MIIYKSVMARFHPEYADIESLMHWLL